MWALSYGEAGGKQIGDVSPVEISVTPSRDGRMRVGFFESSVGGLGRMWEGGRIDGPSAGALFTVGILAALRDEEIRNDAAMTGTINPDGTIGPVGGISYKLDGAALAGKKLVLIPAGNRVQRDANLDRDVDLVERGNDLGVEVREVRNIYEAYRDLTGQSLPRSPDGDHPRMTEEGLRRGL